MIQKNLYICYIDSPALHLCGRKTLRESPVYEGRSEVTPLTPKFTGDFCITAFSVIRAVLPSGTRALPAEGQSPVKCGQWFSNDLLPDHSQAIQYGYFKLRHYWCRLVNSLIGGKGVDLLCLTTSKPFSLTQHITN